MNEFKNHHRGSQILSEAPQLMHQHEAGRLFTETTNCGRYEGLRHIRFLALRFLQETFNKHKRKLAALSDLLTV